MRITGPISTVFCLARHPIYNFHASMESCGLVVNLENGDGGVQVIAFAHRRVHVIVLIISVFTLLT